MTFIPGGFVSAAINNDSTIYMVLKAKTDANYRRDRNKTVFHSQNSRKKSLFLVIHVTNEVYSSLTIAPIDRYLTSHGGAVIQTGKE